MFKVYYDGSLLYDPSDPDLCIHDGTANLAVNSAGTLTLTIGQENDALEDLQLMRGIIELRDGSTVLFRGRIVKDSIDFFKRHKIECEGILAALNDTWVDPYAFPSDYLLDPDYQEAADSGNVIEFWLDKLLEAHNDKVGTEQQIHLGTVTVTDPNNYISRSNEKHSTTWQTISEKMVKEIGGYIVPRYESSGTYIDYLASFPSTNVQEVRFAQNLLDLSNALDGQQMFTAILPVGKDGITIDSIADGSGTGYVHEGKIVYSPDAETALDGNRIIKIVEWSDVTQASNLLSKAISMLVDNAGTMPDTITVKACDLSGVGSTPIFQIGKMVKLVTQDGGTGTLYPLMQIRLDLLNKANADITMGETRKTFSKRVGNDRADFEQSVTDIYDSLSEVQNAADGVADRVRTVESSLTQTAADIQATVSMISELGDNVESELTQIRQDQSSVEIRVEDIVQNGVGKVVTQTGFRFDEDGLTVSKSGTPMETNIDEDGMEVTRSGERVLVADSNGVNAINLTARQYLTIGTNSRFEDYQSVRTACFFVGG